MQIIMMFFTTRNDIWLSNLNWNYKNLRRKGKSVNHMNALVKKMSVNPTAEDCTISSYAAMRKGAVHLPGFPEYDTIDKSLSLYEFI